MSNIEHLIENAITCLEGNKDFDYFTTMWQNKEMLKYVNASPEEIWEMAIYVVTTYKDGIVWDTEDKIEKKYGYPIPEDKVMGQAVVITTMHDLPEGCYDNCPLCHDGYCLGLSVSDSGWPYQPAQEVRPYNCPLKIKETD